MSRKLEFLLQIQPGSQTDNSAAIIFLVILIFIGMMIWALMQNADYQDAKREFQADPSDPEKKQRLIKAGRFRSGNGSNALEVMSIISESEERERRRQQKKGAFVDELQSLADLHSKGVLTDEEFERAKARLLK